MESVFSKDIQDGLDMARIATAKKRSRLRVRAGKAVFPVLRLWKSGFAIEEQAPPLRGLVDLHDGERHLFQCLIMTSAEEAGERQYEFKRATAVSDSAARDFALPDNAPVALIASR